VKDVRSMGASRTRRRRGCAIAMTVTVAVRAMACDAAHAVAFDARAMHAGWMDVDLDASSGRARARGFVVDYAATPVERAIADVLGRVTSADGEARAGLGVAGEVRDAEVALVRRARKGTETARAMGRIRGGDDAVGRGMRGGVFVPNGWGGAGAASVVAESGRRVFATESCASEFDSVEGEDGVEVEYDAAPLRAYLRARDATSNGHLRAVVMTCGDDGDSSEDSGELFADDLDAIERAGVSAVGVIYDDDDERYEGKITERVLGGERRRNLLEDDADEEPKCGALCGTQVELVMGVIIFWGFLLALMYGWGLMTDLDTPQYWGKPDEKPHAD